MSAAKDARAMSRKDLHRLRLRVVELWQTGLSVAAISRETGLTWPAVNAALQLHADGGVGALMPKARGRKPGSGRALTPAQEAEVRRLMGFRPPWHYGLRDRLWSRPCLL